MTLVNYWCPRTDSNRGPIDYKSIALPAELQGHAQYLLIIYKLINSFFSGNLNDEIQLQHYLIHLDFEFFHLSQS